MAQRKTLILITIVAAFTVVGCGDEDEKKLTGPPLDGSTGSVDSGNPSDVSVPDAAADAKAPDAAPVADAAAVVDAFTPDVAPVTKDAGPACIDAGGAADGGCVAALALFNTGVNPLGVALEGGSVDPHYTLIKSADPTFTGPNAIVTSSIADGYWLAQSAAAKWIAPSANQSYPGADPCNASGTYVFRTTFDLTGYDATTAKITGGWAADNFGTAVSLNGVSQGITAGSYNPLTPFVIGNGFVAGRNTLDFEISDVGCPNGLRVELSGTAVVK